jgi:hypothetical protein
MKTDERHMLSPQLAHRRPTSEVSLSEIEIFDLRELVPFDILLVGGDDSLSDTQAVEEFDDRLSPSNRPGGQRQPLSY